MLLQRHLVLQRSWCNLWNSILNENYNKLLFTTYYQLLLKEALSTWAAKSWPWQILFSVGLSDALQEFQIQTSSSLIVSLHLSFRRLFFSWMCIWMFFSSVDFHLFNHSESLAADIACPCFLFMLPTCQVIRQMHQIRSEPPHSLYISLLSVNYLHSMKYRRLVAHVWR